MPKTAIRAGKLVDGTGRAPVENALILVDGERFTAVAPDGAPVPDGYEVIEADSYTVLPGLIDCHLHISGSGDPRERGVSPLARSIPSFTLSCYTNAHKDLMAGWTTIRDASCQHFADVAVRDAINSGRLVGPRIWCSGLGITSTTGHMDREKGLPPHVSLPGLSGVADGPVEARRAVRLNLRYNVDIIKMNATLSEHVRRYGGYCAPEMTRETMEAIIDEAHWHGRKVTAHCHGGPGVTWAVEVGIDGLDHGFFIDDRQLDAMAEKGVTLCPTLTVLGRFREMMSKGIAAETPELEVWRSKAVASGWNTVRRARQAGVKVICGTDCAMPYAYHGTNAYELEMLVEAGLSPSEAIFAATGGAADGIGFDDVGRVLPGKNADLVFVAGNPLDDVRILQDLSKIAIVMKGGSIVVDRR
jgi:imidazolonepropionase-like amidohydrolase